MKKLLTTFLCVALAASCMLFTACGDKPSGKKADYDLLSSAEWKDMNAISVDPDNAHAGEAVYTFNKTTDKSKQMSPLKVSKFNNGEYSALVHKLGAIDLTGYKKLVIKAKSNQATYHPNPPAPTEEVPNPETPADENVDSELLIKWESKPEILGANEKIVKLTATEQTFEFKLDYDNYELALSGAVQLTLIAGPGKPNYKADITISAMYFTVDDTVAANVINDKGTVVAPIVYNGTDASLDVNKSWANNDPNLACKYESGKTTITVNTAKAEWGYVQAVINGNISALKKIHIKFKAQAGITFKMKLQPVGYTALETKTADEVAATGEIQEWNVDFSAMQGWDVEGNGAGNLPVENDAETAFLIFPTPGASVATQYTIEIIEFTFLK